MTMINTTKISSLAKVGEFIKHYLDTDVSQYTPEQEEFSNLLRRSEIENPWFTQENLKFALQQWATLLNEHHLKTWQSKYQHSNATKKVGLILAGNIPLVGFHDVICVLLSGHIPYIKQSSKDTLILPFLLNLWNRYSEGNLEYHIVEKLEHYDAIIATGSNNTARYLEYYFKSVPHIIRKNRTSVAVLSGEESDAQLKKLGEDIFRYFGLGCRNVSKIFLPKDFELDRIFENFERYKDIINHHKYANNYDYNRAVYLLNQEVFWDNNFVMLKEDDALFTPLSVVNFSRYDSIDEVKNALDEKTDDIQCIVADSQLGLESLDFGQAQTPDLETYADNVDTMAFLCSL